MRKLLNASRRSIVQAFGVSVAVCLPAVSSDIQSREVYIKSIQGAVTYSTDHSTWSDLKPGMTLGKGDELRTGPDSTADLESEYSGTALRLRPNSLLELARLDEMVAGEDVIINTRLNLKSGTIVGSQHKLVKPSTFTITTPNSSATIKGTEYLVASDGTVACFRGEVAVNSSHQGNWVTVEVPAGFSFNPVKGLVVATPSDNLLSFSRDLQAVCNNADKLRIDRGYPCREPYPPVSPIKCHHPSHPGKDHEHGYGDDYGDGHNY